MSHFEIPVPVLDKGCVPMQQLIENSWFQQIQYGLLIGFLQRMCSAESCSKSTFFSDKANYCGNHRLHLEIKSELAKITYTELICN